LFSLDFYCFPSRHKNRHIIFNGNLKKKKNSYLNRSEWKKIVSEIVFRSFRRLAKDELFKSDNIASRTGAEA
jgi:hypothetical protein